MYVPDHDRVFVLPEAPPSLWRRAVMKIADGFRAWRNRRAVAGLLDLDERMLRDIGLSRSDVTSALAGRRRDDPSVRLANTTSERRMAQRAAGRQTWSVGGRHVKLG